MPRAMVTMMTQFVFGVALLTKTAFRLFFWFLYDGAVISHVGFLV